MNIDFLRTLSEVIRQRHNQPTDTSYTAQLFTKGTPKIAQKVGEEAVELVIEAMANDTERFKGEAADLLFHYLVLLEDRGLTIADILAVLETRHK